MSTVQAAPQPQAADDQPEGTPVRWALGTRIAFRFVFAYFVLYNLPFPIDWIPYTDYLTLKYGQLWQALAPWTGKHILHLRYPITIFTNGSGDTTYNYVVAVCGLVLAIAATLIWSLLDHKRPNYRILQQWFKLYIRFALAQHMITYGALKVIKNQFPDLRLSDLVATYGQSTPMHLLWNFMGASRTYTVFSGAVEMLGGILLIVPRLALLGALVCVGAMTNVFMLNMSYDVPVKLFSFHLLLMSAVLATPDLQRLANLFVFNRRVEAANDAPLFRRKWLTYSLLAVQLAFGSYMVAFSLYQSYESYETVGNGAPKAPLQGAWVVDEFSEEGQGASTVARDQNEWQQVIFDDYSEVAIQSTNGWRQRYRQKIDTVKKTVSLWRREGPPPAKPQFVFAMPEADSMTLDGELDDRRIHAKLHRLNDSRFMLTSRGFHWINEYPFNRYDEH